MKKPLSLVLSTILIFSIFSVNVFAAEAPAQINDTKTVVVEMEDVLAATANPSKTMTLTRDIASMSGTGTVTSVGQLVDLRTVIPAGNDIVSITLYCPTIVKVTQSLFTSIDNWVVTGPQGSCSIPFWRTNTPTTMCKSTVFAGTDANVRFLVNIQGTILQNQSGFDGFDVFGGAKMIIEYKPSLV